MDNANKCARIPGNSELGLCLIAYAHPGLAERANHIREEDRAELWLRWRTAHAAQEVDTTTQ